MRPMGVIPKPVIAVAPRIGCVMVTPVAAGFYGRLASSETSPAGGPAAQACASAVVALAVSYPFGTAIADAVGRGPATVPDDGLTPGAHHAKPLTLFLAHGSLLTTQACQKVARGRITQPP